MSYTNEQFDAWYASEEFEALMDGTGWTFSCSSYNATFFPCPYPYVPNSTWSWENSTVKPTHVNGPCQITFSDLDGPDTGIVIQRLVWWAFYLTTGAITVYRLAPIWSAERKKRRKKINSVEMCLVFALIAIVLGIFRMIDFNAGSGTMPYFMDGLFVNCQVSTLLCILYTITNSWVAVMSAKGKRAKVPFKWALAYKIWVVLTFFFNTAGPIIESFPSYEGMALAKYFGQPNLSRFLGFYSSGFGMVRLLMNTLLCLSYSTACFLFGLGIAKKLTAGSTTNEKNEATKRQVAQIRKYQMGIQFVVILASGYWMMKFFSYLGSPHVWFPPKCSFFSGLVDISTLIVSIAIIVVLILLNPRKKSKKKKVGANGQTLTSSISEGASSQN